MSHKPVRIAVIGEGRWGKNIIKTLGSMPECTVAYTVTRDYKKLLKQTDIDAIVVATPPSTHANIALPFIKRGLPVFIEKPLTASAADAEKLLAASREHRASVFVGHIHLYNPAYAVAKKEIARAGKLRMLIGEGGSNGPFRDDYSAMWDWAPHDLSMMLDIAGMPTAVQAWGEALTRPKSRLHDFTLMRLLFPGGAVGVIHSSKISPEKRRKFTAVGAKHSVIYDDTAEKKVTVFRNAGPTVSKKKVTANQPELSHPEYESASPLALELEVFVRMVKTKKKPLSSLESGVQVVHILEAAEQSIAAGGKIVKIKK